MRQALPYGEKSAVKSSAEASKKVASLIWLVYIGSSTERSLRLSVRTPGFQPGKRGSIPLGSANIPHIFEIKCVH